MVASKWSAVEELGFELGDAAVLEAAVGAGGLESFFEGAFVLGEFADSLRSIARNLCRLFWSDLETHHPGIDSLRLTPAYPATG
uniref:hypothetical protein n=1 Tax=Streptomyces atratus TaxID=1893 RepID=UPI002F914ECB